MSRRQESELWRGGLDDSDTVGTDVAKLAEGARRIAESDRARGGHHHSDRSALAGTEFPRLPISDHRLINDKPHPRPRTATGAVPSVPASGTPGSEALRERVVAGQFSVRARDLSTPRDAELLPQDVAMRLRRPWRDAEPLSNLFVRVPGRAQLDDLLLSRSHNGRACLQHRRHSPDGNKGVLSWLLTKKAYLARYAERITRRAAPAHAAQTKPHARARSRSAAARARGRRSAPAARTRRAGASASSRGRRLRW